MNLETSCYQLQLLQNMHQVVFMHQGCHTWKVKRFLNLANKAQISPLGQRGIHTNMTTLTSFVLEWTQLPLASTLEYLVVVLCPLLEPIVWFYSSPTMVAKSIKVLVDMVFGILNVVPLDPIFNVMFYKKDINHECKLKIISLKITSVFVPCYDGWKNNFKGGFWKSLKIWICHDDLNCYVGGYEKSMWLIVLIIRHVKEATNLTHDEIITKKKSWFCFF